MTDYQEYMNSLLEQIENHHAKVLVKRELQNHIEEQKEAYQSEGMPEDEALQEAVRQMGNPVDTGVQLNKLHRPKFPGKLLGVSAMLTAAGIFVQLLIYFKMRGSEDVISMINIPFRTVVYNLIGFAVMACLIFMDYSFWGRYAYCLYIGYLMLTAVPWILDNIFSIVVTVNSDYGMTYFITALFPLVLAGLIYRNRGYGVAGFMRCMLLTAVVLIINKLVLQHGISRIIETAVICTALLVAAAARGIFDSKRKHLGLICTGIAGVFAIGAAFFLLTAPEYVRLIPRSGIDLVSDYIAASLFSCLGILAGTAVLAALVIFAIYTLRVSLRQSNRLGMLLGCAASISLLVRTALLTAGNLGFGWSITTSVPFLMYGLRNAVLNAVFVGILLSVYRSSTILPEIDSAEKNTEKIHRFGHYQITVRRVR